MGIADRVAALDTSLFDPIETQTSADDRRSLLALHAAAAGTGPFEYLEIGSHLGGSLQALVRDPRCSRIVSVDSRPASQPDERGRRWRYGDNSTARMLGLLGALEGADVDKIETIEATTAEVDPGGMGAPLVSFIDGEHTDEAALADARWCRSVLDGRPGLIAFHDGWIVHRAIRRFLEEFGTTPFTAALLPESIVAVELGSPGLLASDPVRLRTERAVWGYLDSLGRQRSAREVLEQPPIRLLRRLRLVRF